MPRAGEESEEAEKSKGNAELQKAGFIKSPRWMEKTDSLS